MPVDLPLIKYASGTGKSMSISKGMPDAQEIQEAIDAAREGGCRELAILHCVSGYPAPAHDYNLLTILYMIQRFGLVTGLSDHTLDNNTEIISAAIGVSIIQKHFTLDGSSGGFDDSFSLELAELAPLCLEAKTAWHSLSKVDYSRKPSVQANEEFRRSLYFIKDMKAGEIIDYDFVSSIRHGYSPPKGISTTL